MKSSHFFTAMSCRKNLFPLFCIVSGCIFINMCFWLGFDFKASIIKFIGKSSTIEDYEQRLLSASDDANCSSRNYFTLAKNETLCHQAMPTYLEHFFANAGKINKSHLVDFGKIALIVSINRPEHFAVIPKIYQLYNGIFYKIVYCVTGISHLDDFRNGTYLPLVNISIIEFLDHVTNPTGELFYSCLPKSLELLPNLREAAQTGQITGFLHSSDDLVLNLWNFNKFFLNPQRNWVIQPHLLYDIDKKTICRGKSKSNTEDCQNNESWGVLGKYQASLQASLNEISEKYPDFIERLANSTNGYRRVFNAYADFFYVKAKDMVEHEEIFTIFAKNGVYMELAVGNILHGISSTRNDLSIVPNVGSVSNEGRELRVTKTFAQAAFFYHPFKMGNIHLNSSSADLQCLYCMLVTLIDHFRRPSKGKDLQMQYNPTT